MMTPKLTEKTKFYSFKRQSSFGIRKFTIGVVSVSLGTALVATAPAASADTLEPASSALAAPSAELVSQVTTDKTALAQALSAAQAIDLSQQAPEVAEGFVELFVRASALLEQTGATQAELDALAQELQQATVALTAEFPTAVATPVEVAEADELKPVASEEGVTEETPDLENSLNFSVAPETLYPSYVTDISGAMLEILDTDGNRMPEYGTLDGGDGINLQRIVRITVPEGATEQQITLELGEHLTFRIHAQSAVGTSASRPVIVGVMSVDGQVARGSVVSSYSSESVVYKPADGGKVIEIKFQFNLERAFSNLRGLELNNNYNDATGGLKFSDDTADGIIDTRPLSVTYNYTLNGQHAELKAGINSITFLPGQAEKFVPTTTEQRISIGVSADPTLSIANRSDLPADTSYRWKEPLNTSVEGVIDAVVVVTYPDQSSEEVPVRVSVEAIKSHRDLVEEILRKTMAEGKLPIALRKDSDPSSPYLLTTEDPILWQANANKTVFNVDAKVGTEINEAWTVAYDIPVPRSPFSGSTIIGDDVYYDIGDLKGSDIGAHSTTTDGSHPYGRMVSNTSLLANELQEYAKTRLLQADEVYLSGLNKNLADYGLRVEADPVLPYLVGIHRRAGIDNSFNDHYYNVLVGRQTYRLKGTLRLPEGTVGNVAQTTWKDSFYIPLFGNVPRERNIDSTHWNGLPGARGAAETDYSNLSYYLTYTNGIYEPGRTTRNILWGSTEFPLLTSVRVYDDSRPSQAEVYKPTALVGGLTLGINDPIDPAQLIANRSDLPSDARFEFVEPVGEALSGTSKIVSVRIVFSDGSVRTVRSRLTFRLAQAQEYIPEAQSIRVGLGALIRPIDFIKNASSLPADTRYSWAQEPSTRVPGGKVGQIIVTYPDGSTDKITVRFTVR